MYKPASILIALLLFAPGPRRALSQQPISSGGHIRAELRFSGPLTLNGGKKVNVVIQNWTIDEGQKNVTLDLPSNATVVIQVRAGSVFAVAGGKRDLRRTETWWTVPAGVAVRLDTDQDSAILQTITILAP